MPSLGSPSRSSRRFSAYLATCASHSAYDASSNAATAACCDSTGGQMVKLPVSASTGRRSGSGTSIQPIRHPVIEKYLENELKRTASRDVSHAEECRVGVAYSMPW